MSIIGPRPLTQQTYDCYSDEIKSQIKKIRPGLSGIGQEFLEMRSHFQTRIQIFIMKLYHLTRAHWKSGIQK